MFGARVRTTRPISKMGGGVSVDVDASALRKEYETLAAKNVSDEELLSHMKKLIVSPPTGGRVSFSSRRYSRQKFKLETKGFFRP